MEKPLIDPDFKDNPKKALDQSDADFFKFCATGIQMILDLHAQWLAIDQAIGTKPTMATEYSSITQYKADVKALNEWSANSTTLGKAKRKLEEEGTEIKNELWNYIPVLTTWFDPKDFEPDCPKFLKETGTRIEIYTSKGSQFLYVGNSNL